MRLSGVGAERLAASDDRIVVTGAGGWIGRAALELLHDTLGPEAFANRVLAFGSSARTLTLRPGLNVGQRSLLDLGKLAERPTLVLHTAFLTRDRAGEADYVAANRAIRAQVLAALDPIGATAVFVPSSGAARSAEDPDASEATRLYGSLKRADEDAFAEWGGRAVIARVFNLSGRHINKHGSYALASFIGDALAGRPIAIKADRQVLRSYVAVDELLSLAFALLTREEPVARFDTAGIETVELADIAAAVARNVRETGIVRPPVGDGPPDRYVGDGAVYRRRLTECGIVAADFDAQVRETAAFLSEAAKVAA